MLKLSDREVCDLYKAGLSQQKIAGLAGCCQKWVSKIMKKSGQPVRVPERDWSFVNLEDQFFFYWLGWMLSDGCIAYKKTGDRLRGVFCKIAIQAADSVVLELFKNRIQPQAKIYLNKPRAGHKQQKILSLSVPRNVAMALVKWGLVPAKSFILNPPLDRMSQRQFYQFLCGYIEGDGGVDYRIMKSRMNFYGMLRIRIFSASTKFISQLNAKMISLGFKNRKWHTKQTKNGMLHTYSVNGKDAFKLYNKIKSNSQYMSLDRKWSKCNAQKS